MTLNRLVKKPMEMSLLKINDIICTLMVDIVSGVINYDRELQKHSKKIERFDR